MSNIYEVFNVTNDHELSKVFDKLELTYNEMTNIDYIVESMNKENARTKILELMAGSADGNYEICLEQFGKVVKKRVLKEESGLNLNQVMELNQLVELVAGKLAANQQQCLEGLYNIIVPKAGENIAKTFIGMVQQSAVNQSSLKFNTDLVVDGKNLAQTIYALKNEIEMFCNSVKKEESEKEEVKESVNDYSMENHLAGVYNVKNGSFREEQNNLSEEDFRNRLVRYNFQDTDNGKVCYITAWSYADAFNTRGALKKKYPTENVEKWKLEWFQNGDGSWNKPLKKYTEIVGNDGQRLNESYNKYQEIVQELDRAVDDVNDLNILKGIADKVNELMGRVKNMNEANELATLKTTLETKMNSLMGAKPQLEESCLATQMVQDVCGEDTFNGLLDGIKPTLINITVNKEGDLVSCEDDCCAKPCCDCQDNCCCEPCCDCQDNCANEVPCVQPLTLSPTAVDAPILRKPNSAEVTSAITALASHQNDIKSDSRENNIENLQTINTLLNNISNYFNTLLGESKYNVGEKLIYKANGSTYTISNVKDGFYDLKDGYTDKTYPVSEKTLNTEFKKLNETVFQSHYRKGQKLKNYDTGDVYTISGLFFNDNYKEFLYELSKPFIMHNGEESTLYFKRWERDLDNNYKIINNEKDNEEEWDGDDKETLNEAKYARVNVSEIDYGLPDEFESDIAYDEDDLNPGSGYDLDALLRDRINDKCSEEYGKMPDNFHYEIIEQWDDEDENRNNNRNTIISDQNDEEEWDGEDDEELDENINDENEDEYWKSWKDVNVKADDYDSLPSGKYIVKTYDITIDIDNNNYEDWKYDEYVEVNYEKGDDWSDLVSEELTDKIGYCLDGFNYKVIKYNNEDDTNDKNYWDGDDDQLNESFNVGDVIIMDIEKIRKDFPNYQNNNIEYTVIENNKENPYYKLEWTDSVNGKERNQSRVRRGQIDKYFKLVDSNEDYWDGEDNEELDETLRIAGVQLNESEMSSKEFARKLYDSIEDDEDFIYVWKNIKGTEDGYDKALEYRCSEWAEDILGGQMWILDDEDGGRSWVQIDDYIIDLDGIYNDWRDYVKNDPSSNDYLSTENWDGEDDEELDEAHFLRPKPFAEKVRSDINIEDYKNSLVGKKIEDQSDGTSWEITNVKCTYYGPIRENIIFVRQDGDTKEYLATPTDLKNMFNLDIDDLLPDDYDDGEDEEKLNEEKTLPSGDYTVVVYDIVVDEYFEGEYNLHDKKVLKIHHNANTSLDEEIKEAILEDMGESYNSSIKVVDYEYQIVDRVADDQLDEETVYDHSWFEVEGQKYPKRTKNGVEGLPITESKNENNDEIERIHNEFLENKLNAFQAIEDLYIYTNFSTKEIDEILYKWLEEKEKADLNKDDEELNNIWDNDELDETCSAGACCAASVATVPSTRKKKSKPRKSETADLSLFKESVRNDCPVTLNINGKKVSYKIVEGKGYLYIDNGIVKTLDKNVILETIDDVFNDCVDIEILEGFNSYDLNILLEDDINPDLGDVNSTTTITPDEKKKQQQDLDNNLKKNPTAKVGVVTGQNNGEIKQNQEFVGIDDHDENNKKYIVKDPATGEVRIVDYNQIKLTEI